MNATERLIRTCIELGSARTMELLGVTSGEISQRQARATYGKWFADACAAHRIFPCRVEAGRAGTRWYKVTDILSVKAADAANCQLNII